MNSEIFMRAWQQKKELYLYLEKELNNLITFAKENGMEFIDMRDKDPQCIDRFEFDPIKWRLKFYLKPCATDKKETTLTTEQIERIVKDFNDDMDFILNYGIDLFNWNRDNDCELESPAILSLKWDPFTDKNNFALYNE